jgi:hypothetical protein
VGVIVKLRSLLLLARICNFLAAEAYVIRLNLPLSCYLKSRKSQQDMLHSDKSLLHYDVCCEATYLAHSWR